MGDGGGRLGACRCEVWRAVLDNHELWLDSAIVDGQRGLCIPV